MILRSARQPVVRTGSTNRASNLYTLYYAPGACSLSVHIVLEWVNADYKAVKVNPSDPDYLRINPAGAVPALDLGTSAALTQCSAILKYLAAKHPEADLDEPEDAERAADLARWAAFLTGDLHPAFFPVFNPQRYTADTCEEAIGRVRAAAMELVKKKLSVIDHQLAGRRYFMGDKLSYVDAYAVPMVRWAKNILPTALGEFPNVARHHNELLSNIGVTKAMTDEGIHGR